MFVLPLYCSLAVRCVLRFGLHRPLHLLAIFQYRLSGLVVGSCSVVRITDDLLRESSVHACCVLLR